MWIRALVIENKQAVIWLQCSWDVCVCAIGLCSSEPLCKKTPTSSWTLGSRRGLHVENSDPTDSLSPHHTQRQRVVCIVVSLNTPTLTPHPQLHPGLTVTRPDSCSDRHYDVYWISGNLLRKSASPHVQICIFESTLTSVYLCPTTSQQDLLCPNLKRVSQFPKVECLKCLEECKRNVVEIIQEEIAVIS